MAVEAAGTVSSRVAIYLAMFDRFGALKVRQELMQAAAAMASAGGGPGKCQQVWCPVCALAALASGEQHPMLTVVAEHSVALMAMIRAMVADLDSSGPPPDGPPASPGEGPGAGAPGQTRYQPIPITVEE